jgi:hypothetical protein
MVKIDERKKCSECGSVWSEIIINEDFHKVLVRKCHNNCSKDKEVLEDYGFSQKAKIKNEKKQKRLEIEGEENVKKL